MVEFTKAKKLEEIIVAIAQFSGLSTTEIERLFMGTWTSPVAVIFKAIGYHLATVEAIYRSRLANGEVARDDRTDQSGIHCAAPPDRRAHHAFFLC